MKLTPVQTKAKLEPVKKPEKKVVKQKPKPQPPPKPQLNQVEKALIQLKELMAISTAKTVDMAETNAAVLRKALEQLNKRQKIEFNPEITIKPEREKITIRHKIKHARNGRIQEVVSEEL